MRLKPNNYILSTDNTDFHRFSPYGQLLRNIFVTEWHKFTRIMPFGWLLRNFWRPLMTQMNTDKKVLRVELDFMGQWDLTL